MLLKFYVIMYFIIFFLWELMIKVLYKIIKYLFVFYVCYENYDDCCYFGNNRGCYCLN